MNLYSISNLSKHYGEGTGRVMALDRVNLTLPEKKFIVILGASGSGKSTLLNILGSMDKPTHGQLYFYDKDISNLNRKQMTAFRSENIGFVFQSYNLLSDLTALENVEFSTELAKLDSGEAVKSLEMVGLAERLHHYPAQLSGGEQQRVSIARAIAKKPKVLLCDEPTGALDYKTGVQVLEVLAQVYRERNTSVLLITHNQEIAKMADIVITLSSGEVSRITENPHPISPSEVVW